MCDSAPPDVETFTFNFGKPFYHHGQETLASDTFSGTPFLVSCPFEGSGTVMTEQKAEIKPFHLFGGKVMFEFMVYKL